MMSNPYQSFVPYNPFFQQQQMMPQQPMMPQQTNLQPNNFQQEETHNADEKIYVQGEAAARAYLVAPNSFVRLWDDKGKVFYEKRADASGMPSMTIYKYEQIESEEAEAKNDYLAKLEARIKALESQMKKETKKNAKSDPTDDPTAE